MAAPPGKPWAAELNHPERRTGDSQSGQASCGGEQHVFDHELARNLPRSRPHRQPDGHVLASDANPYQRETRDVHAANQ